MISKKILNALTKEQAVEEIRKELRNCNFPFCTSTEELELAERR